jgi:HAE1 family hydrophobic/amphiphilic exporter-1
MNLPEISIRRPVTAVMAILSIIVIGGVCFTRIGIDFFPDIEFPNVALVTTYEGAAPEEVETIVLLSCRA